MTVLVYDLATMFRLTTKEVLERLQGAGIEATTFGSAVDEVKAREILSRPQARIPVKTIRPGTGTLIKPTTRRTTRAKAGAPKTPAGAVAPMKSAETPAKPRTRKKPPSEEPVTAEGKPRTRKTAATTRSRVKPLVVTLEAPTVEPGVAVVLPVETTAPEGAVLAVQAPAPEVPRGEVPVGAAVPEGVPSVTAAPVELPSAVAPPAPAETEKPVEPPKVLETHAPGEELPVEPTRMERSIAPPQPTAERVTPPAPPPPQTLHPAPSVRIPPPARPAQPRREPPRPAPRAERPAALAEKELAKGIAPVPVSQTTPRPEPPRPAIEPPRPMMAEAQAPALDALEAPAAPVILPPIEPEVSPPPETRIPVREREREIPLVRPKPEPVAPPVPPPAVPKVLKIGEGMSPKELAEKMSATASDVIKRLIKLGVLATINTSVDFETIGKVAHQFGYSVERASAEELIEEVAEVEDPRLLRPRAPVVTVMGHVDHGKTSLLDAIRRTNVIATEAGGITQHIGAYDVEVPGHAVDRVVFLDTPGHVAFTAMRARGAQATDIVVLVVAADDGVMPQTIEAVNHAKDAKVPILVAVNKIDKPNADPNRIKQQLAEYGLVPEEWGGDTIFVPISAKRREGIDNLLDNLLVLAEVQELKANPDKPGRGVVIEAQLDKGRGPVVTVLMQSGSLRVGDAVVAGLHHGRVRAMISDKGKKLTLVGPATAVEILGLSGVPLAGDNFAVVGEERKARQIALARQEMHRQATMVAQPRITLDDLHQRIEQGEVKELRLIIKGDVQGSVEPLQDSLQRLGTGQVLVKTIHSSVGAITESDVMLAAASNAIIVGFNVRPEPKAQRLAEQEKVDVRLYTIIYEAINQVKAALEGLLEPQYVERALGRVEVRQVFTISKVGTIAGSFVADGKVVRDASVRVVRDGRVAHEGKIASLKRFKDDVREVLSGMECGIGLANFNDIHQGDILEVFEVEEIAPKLQA
jgi:translation initiation factor IF-2